MLDQVWAIAFLLTEAVETPIYAVALRRFNMIQRLVLALVASLLTHPWVWLFVSARSADEYWSSVAISEIAAVLVEAGYLRTLAIPSALGWSALANGLSMALGFFYQAFWGLT
jgi:hypothetical protein